MYEGKRGGKEMKEVILSEGRILIASVTQGNRQGILLRDIGEPREINSVFNTYDTEYQEQESDVVIWIDKLESGRVLQDRINYVCLAMQNYVFGNKLEAKK